LFDLGDPILAARGQDPTADALSPVMVEYYEQVGFLPAGVLNALFRLGWSLDDQTEVLPLDTVIREFSLERVNRSPAGLDPDKLISFQSHWIGQLSAEEKLVGCLPYLSTAGWVDPPISDETQQRCLRVIELAADRLRVFGDILQFDEFFLNDSQVKRDDMALQKRLRQSEAIPTALEALAQQFDLNDAIDASSANALLNEVAAGHDLKAGKLFPAVRLCVSGKSQGPDLFRSLELIGGTACARRIRQAVQRCMETETE
jgi:glutamyl-tRNA synthetase